MDLSDDKIPLIVPQEKKAAYVASHKAMTKGSGKLFLFAGDQKIEHLNKDFFGTGISSDSARPEHLFNIAARARIGCFATQLGLISRYAKTYSGIPYLVKMNAKTDLVSSAQRDPVSRQLTALNSVLVLRDSGVSVVGVGYTLYLGSEFESEMLHEAAKLIFDAHREGLLTVLWMYPRGKAVVHERAVDIIAGAAGVANCLGADFVKINPPLDAEGKSQPALLKQVVAAAGNTGVICSGGASKEPQLFLQELDQQMIDGGIAGAAIGRNIHQKPLEQAIAFCNAIAAKIYDR